MTRVGIIYLASVVAHGALAIGIVSLRDGRVYEDVAISLVDAKKKPEPAKVEPPPPAPEPELPKEQPKAKAAPPAPKPVAAEPVAAAEAAPASEGAHDFGLSLGGASGPGGLAVRAGGPAPTTSTTAAAPPPVHKVLSAAPAADTCDEPLKKPKPISISQPAYTSEARTANIAGKVRVELTVDATGHVTKARVLEGLGYGLDEAALAAARAATFEPGTKCGKPTTATFTIAMRFTL